MFRINAQRSINIIGDQRYCYKEQYCHKEHSRLDQQEYPKSTIQFKNTLFRINDTILNRIYYSDQKSLNFVNSNNIVDSQHS